MAYLPHRHGPEPLQRLPCRLVRGLGGRYSNVRLNGIPLPSTAVHAQLFQAMLQMGMAELDNSAVIGVIEALAGTTLHAD